MSARRSRRFMMFNVITRHVRNTICGRVIIGCVDPDGRSPPAPFEPWRPRPTRGHDDVHHRRGRRRAGDRDAGKRAGIRDGRAVTKRRGGVVRVSARTTVVALMLGATVVACLPGTARSPAFTAETVGIVSTRQLDDVDLRYTFTDVRSIVVPHTTREIGSQPDAGHLFLGGSQPEPWFKGIPPKPVSPGDPIPAGCYQLDGPAWRMRRLSSCTSVTPVGTWSWLSQSRRIGSTQPS